MKNTLCLLFLCLSLVAAKSQNLVPNPSFETIDTCPYFDNQIYFASPWFQPCIIQGNTTISSSSDLYSTCSSSQGYGIPENGLSFQYAKSGNGYAGIALYSSGVNCSEYIEVKLISPLTQNRKYCVEFYVSFAATNFVVSNIGAYFSHDSLLNNSPYNAIDNVIPQIENPTTNMLSDTLNWMLVSGNFIANGGEEYMTIGNFHLNSLSNVQAFSVISFPWAYYFVDDLSVVDCTGVGEEEMGMSNVEIMPNPATNEIMLTANQQLKTIHIYNVLGEEVLRLERIANSQKAIDISTWKAGVYFVEVETEKGVVRKRLVKEK